MMRALIIRWIGLVGVGAFCFAALIMTVRVGAMVGNSQTERCYVEARYASHLAQGLGFSANPDQVSELAPPFVPGALLAAVTHIFDRDTARLDEWLTPALIGLAGVLLYILLIGAKLSPWAAIPAALISMGGGYVWGGSCSSPQVSIVIVLGALLLIQHGRFRWGGIMAGLAVGAGLENLVLIVLIAAFVDDSSAQRRFLSGALIPLAGLILLVIIGVIPARPLILFEGGSPLEHMIPILEKKPLLLVYGALAAIGAGALRNQDRPLVRLLAGWGALSLLITWGFLGAPAYLPAWMGISALIGVALASVIRDPPWVSFVFSVGVIGLLLIPIDTQHLFDGDPNPWLGWEQEIPADARIGSTIIGRTIYGLDRPTTDLSGRLDLAIGAALKRGDLDYGVIRDLPEYLVLREPDVTALHQHDWFQRGYLQLTFGGTYNTYHRTAAAGGAFSATHPADLSAGEGLRLTGYAVDHPALLPGSPFRVRLDWQSAAILAPFQIETVLIQPPDVRFATGTLNLLSARWRAGQFSTYHWLFPEERPYAPGMLSLLVTVKYNEGQAPSGVIGALKVKPPTISLPSETLSLRLGDSIRLQKTSLEQNADTLKVQTLWTTDAPLPADYTILAHLVPNGSDAPAATGDGQPLYPTSVWEPGEVFVDERVIPLEDIPSGIYEVRIGLYLADGTRLRLGDGKDYYPVGQVEVTLPPAN